MVLSFQSLAPLENWKRPCFLLFLWSTCLLKQKWYGMCGCAVFSELYHCWGGTGLVTLMFTIWLFKWPWNMGWNQHRSCNAWFKSSNWSIADGKGGIYWQTWNVDWQQWRMAAGAEESLQWQTMMVQLQNVCHTTNNFYCLQALVAAP